MSKPLIDHPSLRSIARKAITKLLCSAVGHTRQFGLFKTTLDEYEIRDMCVVCTRVFRTTPIDNVTNVSDRPPRGPAN